MEPAWEAGGEKRKRPRVAAACVMCRLSRLSCDGQQPCQRCTKGGSAASCVYVEQKKRGRPSRRNKERPEAPVAIVPLPTQLPVVSPNIHPSCSAVPSFALASALSSRLAPAGAARGGAPAAAPSDVVAQLLSKEVHTAREEARAANQRAKEMEEELRALRLQVQAQAVSLRGQSLSLSEQSSPAAKRRHILSHLPFLSVYDLASPDVPFAITDMEKPVAVVKATLRLTSPLVCVYANQAFSSLAGCPMSELIGERAITAIVHDYRNKIKILSLAMSSKGQRCSPPGNVSVLVIHKDGTLIRMASKVQIFRLQDGQLGWSVVSFEEMECVETMSTLASSYPRLYERLVAFSQDSVVGSMEDVVECRKEVIRACEKEEWRELLLPMGSNLCTPSRTLLALSTEATFFPPTPSAQAPSPFPHFSSLPTTPSHSSSSGSCPASPSPPTSFNQLGCAIAGPQGPTQSLPAQPPEPCHGPLHELSFMSMSDVMSGNAPPLSPSPSWSPLQSLLDQTDFSGSWLG